MAVRIQILDYNYSNNTVGNNLITDPSLATGVNWDAGNGWTIANGHATHTAGSFGYLNATNITLFQGQRYKIEYKIENRTAGSFVLANHLEGGANGFIQTNNGVFEYEWQQGGSNLDKLSLWGSSDFNGNIKYVNLFALSGIDRSKSIIGELELTDHSDFPFALTFQIADAKDITATTGEYSKTFKVPATKNNNKLLKHIYNPLVVPQTNMTTFKDCTIIVDGMQELQGLIKISGMGGYGKNISYYDCTFFGNNISWAKKIEGKYLNEPDLFQNSKNLVYNREGIIATWSYDNCTSGSPIVYPVTSYGDFNPEGLQQSIQLLKTHNQVLSTGGAGYYGYNNNGDDYGTPEPSQDWRPAVFVKTTLESIFKKVGYTISSDFMNTDMFKKLVWLLPNFKYNNPDERVDNFSAVAKVINENDLQAPADSPLPAIDEKGCWEIGREINFEDCNQNSSLYNAANDSYIGGAREEVAISTAENLNVTLDNNSHFNMANNYIEISEYGKYIINLSGLQARAARVFRDDSVTSTFRKLDCVVNIELKTVGHTSWNIIGEAKLDDISPSTTGSGGGTQGTNNSTALFSDYQDVQKGEVTIFLNKGDRIRLTKGVKITEVGTDTLHDFKIYIFWKALDNSNFSIRIDPNNVYYGQTYNLENVIEPKYKQIDFIKGVAHAFNLVISTDSINNKVKIEPFDNFYQVTSQAIDWTYKLDRSKEIKDVFLQSNLKKDIIFKYKTDDADAKVKHRGETYFHGILDEYPYKEELTDEFEKGESIFENPFFAGTYNAADKDAASIDVHSACLWQEKENGTQTSPNDVSRPDKGYNFMPRLLYWNNLKLNQSSSFVNYAARIQSWNTNVPGSAELINANINYTTAAVNIYPQAVSINRNDKSYPVLSYGNVWVRELDLANTNNVLSNNFSNYEIGKGLYETYYRSLIEMMKLSLRKRTLFIDLKSKDIINLDYSKLIYLDGCYWRIIRIIDYRPNQNIPTKVELIEWIETGTHALESPFLGSSGEIESYDFDVIDTVITDLPG
tara:strand:+ start:692 stop:3766 length:3075 start_codon:yes stop_codon:yes gene_type:complete